MKATLLAHYLFHTAALAGTRISFGLSNTISASSIASGRSSSCSGLTLYTSTIAAPTYATRTKSKVPTSDFSSTSMTPTANVSSMSANRSTEHTGSVTSTGIWFSQPSLITIPLTMCTADSTAALAPSSTVPSYITTSTTITGFHSSSFTLATASWTSDHSTTFLRMSSRSPSYNATKGFSSTYNAAPTTVCSFGTASHRTPGTISRSRSLPRSSDGTLDGTTYPSLNTSSTYYWPTTTAPSSITSWQFYPTFITVTDSILVTHTSKDVRSTETGVESFPPVKSSTVGSLLSLCSSFRTITKASTSSDTMLASTAEPSYLASSLDRTTNNSLSQTRISTVPHMTSFLSIGPSAITSVVPSDTSAVLTSSSSTTRCPITDLESFPTFGPTPTTPIISSITLITITNTSGTTSSTVSDLETYPISASSMTITSISASSKTPSTVAWSSLELSSSVNNPTVTWTPSSSSNNVTKVTRTALISWPTKVPGKMTSHAASSLFMPSGSFTIHTTSAWKNATDSDTSTLVITGHYTSASSVVSGSIALTVITTPRWINTTTPYNTTTSTTTPTYVSPTLTSGSTIITSSPSPTYSTPAHTYNTPSSSYGMLH